MYSYDMYSDEIGKVVRVELKNLVASFGKSMLVRNNLLLFYFCLVGNKQKKL